MSNTLERKYWVFALRIAGDFGATIAVPVVLFVYLGKKLDARWDTQPWLMIAGFVLAASISGISIYRKAKKLGSEYQAL
jgi:F0F1-type ATP synthase assembly protein I